MRKYLWVLYLVFSILTLPAIIYLARTVQTYLSRASGTPANIVVDWNATGSPIQKPWQALGQGGEEPPPMLGSVVAEIKALGTQYVRIDHVYDMYAYVSKVEGKIKIDFTKLDETVNDIIQSGARPFFSLSYTPPSLSSDGNISSPPTNWSDWTEIVKLTVEHYSGKSGKNLSEVYYEVWNEPDLFGGYKVSGDRDYRILYLNSVNGAISATNTNTFYVGGPATTGMYPNWIDKLLTFTRDNNLRIDFLSWHRYSNDPLAYKRDIESVRNILAKYPQYNGIQLLITEWGIDSENNPFHDNQVSAAHTVASLNQMIGNIRYAFSFEIKDGPSPKNEAFWGRWGLITHDSAGLYKKPRYYALDLLNSLSGQSVLVQGEGSWVTGMAAREGDTLKLILTNYDSSSYHSENVPVTFLSLPDGSYTLTTKYFNGVTSQNELVVTTGKLGQNILMNPNDIVALTLTKNASLASFSLGASSRSGDQALVLSKPFTISSPLFRLGTTGSISFDYKPSFSGSDRENRILVEVPFATGSAVIQKLALQKRDVGFSHRLVFGIFDKDGSIYTSANIDNWEKDTWKNVELSWDNAGLSLSFDGQVVGNLKQSLNIRNGSGITFYSNNSALDNLEVLADGNVILTRKFDDNSDY
ncbi:hypothetical protein HYW54_03615 [Candidatus Gottesmanbacteria bacterium]|nr:hypothetical protein [Candidatus Gottesmanbacteria bacterium]